MLTTTIVHNILGREWWQSYHATFFLVNTTASTLLYEIYERWAAKMTIWDLKFSASISEFWEVLSDWIVGWEILGGENSGFRYKPSVTSYTTSTSMSQILAERFFKKSSKTCYKFYISEIKIVFARNCKSFGLVKTLCFVSSGNLRKDKLNWFNNKLFNCLYLFTSTPWWGQISILCRILDIL